MQVAYSYCASNDPRIHFGLGSATSADTVMVYWPNGTQERFGPFTADRYHEIQQGTGENVETSRRRDVEGSRFRAHADP